MSAIPVSFTNRLPGICVATFLTIVFSSSAAYSQTPEGKFMPAEKWTVEQVTAGEIANLTKQFPDENERKLSAHFLENLLTGALPGVEPHRNGVRIQGAIIDEPLDL